VCVILPSSCFRVLPGQTRMRTYMAARKSIIATSQSRSEARAAAQASRALAPPMYGAPHTPSYLLGRPIFDRLLHLAFPRSCFFFGIFAAERASSPIRPPNLVLRLRPFFARVLFLSRSPYTNYWIRSSPSRVARGWSVSVLLLPIRELLDSLSLGFLHLILWVISAC
jgi:hypothetical protein